MSSFALCLDPAPPVSDRISADGVSQNFTIISDLPSWFCEMRTEEVNLPPYSNPSDRRGELVNPVAPANPVMLLPCSKPQSSAHLGCIKALR